MRKLNANNKQVVILL